MTGVQTCALPIFARKEVEGTRAIQPAHSLLAQLKAERISPADSGKDFRTFAATLGLDAQASTSLAAIAEAHDGESLVAAAESLSDFIGAAADRSNLSLDPDMDSYYLMNALVIDVPSMMVKAAAIRSLARRHGASASDMPVELAIALASFKAAQAGFSASFAKAAAGNADGSLTARLTAPKDALLGAAAGLVDFSSGSNDRTALAAAADRVLENAPAFLDAGLRELERLLQDRIDGFYSVLWTRLAAVLVLVLLGGIFSFITARSFVGPVAEITKAMNRLADGDLSTRIPAVDRQDEIGSIARAVEIFKRSMTTARDLAAKEADQVKMREAREIGRANV